MAKKNAIARDTAGLRDILFDEIDYLRDGGDPIYRHEPLTRAEGEALWAACEAAKKKREETMPDERAAILALQEAYTRLKELGWREAIYCPKNGTPFKVIEPGSTGIHDCNYWGEWPNGGWNVFDEHDSYPSRPILFKLNPEDQAKEDARRARLRPLPQLGE